MWHGATDSAKKTTVREDLGSTPSNGSLREWLLSGKPQPPTFFL